MSWTPITLDIEAHEQPALILSRLEGRLTIVSANAAARAVFTLQALPSTLERLRYSLGAENEGRLEIWAKGDPLGPLSHHLSAFTLDATRLLLSFQRAPQEDPASVALERLELAVLGTALGTWDWDIPSGGVIFDDLWCRMLGYDPEEIAPDISSWAERVHPRDKPWVMKVLNQHLSGETPHYETTHRIRHRRGDHRWILARGRVVSWDHDGAPLRAVGTHQDVTAEKEVELALARERALFVGGPVGVFRWCNAPGWPVELASPNVEAIFGYSKEQFESREILFADLVHPEDLPRVNAEVLAYAEAGVDAFEQSYRVIHADGLARDLFEFTAIQRDAEGEISHFAGYVFDQTERRREERERRRLEARLLEAQRHESLAALAGGIAHDFNNLLVGVLGNLHLLKEDLHGEPENVELAEDAIASAQRAASLSQQMLAYAGKRRPNTQPLDLVDVLRGLEERLRFKDRPRVLLKPSTVSCTVELDPEQLYQLILELVGNAHEALGDAPGEISITIEEADVSAERLSRAVNPSVDAIPGRYALLTISDEGPGMDEGTRLRAFDPFFTTKFTGRGLGLAGVLGVVRGHGGAIWLESALGKGARFEVGFPLASRKPGRVARVAPLSGRAILVVDDEPVVRRLVERVLTREGWEVSLAEDGAHALEQLNAGLTVNVMLLDLTMPGLSGLEVRQEIKARWPKLPIIMMTGYTADRLNTLFGAARERVLLKPFSKEALLTVLREVARCAQRGA